MHERALRRVRGPARTAGPAGARLPDGACRDWLALGIVSEPELGPLVVAEPAGTGRTAGRPRSRCLRSQRSSPPTWQPVFGVSKAAGRDQGARLDDLDAVARAIAGVPELAAEPGKHVEALGVNPLICGPDGAAAVSALAVPHRTTLPVS